MYFNLLGNNIIQAHHNNFNEANKISICVNNFRKAVINR